MSDIQLSAVRKLRRVLVHPRLRTAGATATSALEAPAGFASSPPAAVLAGLQLPSYDTLSLLVYVAVAVAMAASLVASVSLLRELRELTAELEANGGALSEAATEAGRTARGTAANAGADN